jgi:Lon protease-like protein
MSMTNFIPIFPLGIIVYPGESLNLHIFEPRYRQLILECIETKKPFGIPVVIDNSLMEYGTLVEVSALKQQYEDGKMDINTRGLSIFRILEVVKEIPEKLYSGAIVNYPENDTSYISPQAPAIAKAVRELHRLLQVEKTFPKPDDELSSYDLAHLAGLNIHEEYEILQLMREDQRIEYLKRHLQKVVPVVQEMEALKEKIKLNGHFRELKGLGFE